MEGARQPPPPAPPPNRLPAHRIARAPHARSPLAETTRTQRREAVSEGKRLQSEVHAQRGARQAGTGKMRTLPPPLPQTRRTGRRRRRSRSCPPTKSRAHAKARTHTHTNSRPHTHTSSSTYLHTLLTSPKSARTHTKYARLHIRLHCVVHARRSAAGCPFSDENTALARAHNSGQRQSVKEHC